MFFYLRVKWLKNEQIYICRYYRSCYVAFGSSGSLGLHFRRKVSDVSVKGKSWGVACGQGMLLSCCVEICLRIAHIIVIFMWLEIFKGMALNVITKMSDKFSGENVTEIGCRRRCAKLHNYVRRYEMFVQILQPYLRFVNFRFIVQIGF